MCRTSFEGFAKHIGSGEHRGLTKKSLGNRYINELCKKMGSKVRKCKKGGKCMNINVIAEVDEKGEL